MVQTHDTPFSPTTISTSPLPRLQPCPLTRLVPVCGDTSCREPPPLGALFALQAGRHGVMAGALQATVGWVGHAVATVSATFGGAAAVGQQSSHACEVDPVPRVAGVVACFAGWTALLLAVRGLVRRLGAGRYTISEAAAKRGRTAANFPLHCAINVCAGAHALLVTPPSTYCHPTYLSSAPMCILRGVLARRIPYLLYRLPRLSIEGL